MKKQTKTSKQDLSGIIFDGRTKQGRTIKKISIFLNYALVVAASAALTWVIVEIFTR